MSDTEHFKGKLRRVQFPEGIDTIKEKIALLQLSSCQYDLFGEDDLYIDYRSGYVFIKGDFFKVVDIRDATYEDVADMVKIGDDFLFDLKYYNGSTSFQEMIKEAYENLK